MSSPSRSYTFHSKNDSGGQGDVWKATSPSGKIVAYKVFRPKANSPHAQTERERFLREIRTQAKLAHPNIVGVVEDGLDVDGNPYYVMDWADCSLEDRIAVNPDGLPLDYALRLFEKICEAMSYAHDQGVLHRDLKTQNILLFNETPKVSDFGLVRDMNSSTATFTQSALGWGSLFYMPPEQMTKLHDAAKSADVYSLGKILYTMTTGKHPFYGFDVSNAPDLVQYLIMRCTYEAPEDRFQDCTELLAYLRTMVGADASALAPPADQARAALEAVLSGHGSSVESLTEILLQYPNDSSLYTTFLPSVPESVIGRIAAYSTQKLHRIVKNFDQYAEGNQPWDFCDVIADFYERTFKYLSDLPSRRMILERLLTMGASHNRWHVGGVFARLCASAYSQPGCPELIADLLTKNPDERAFVSAYLSPYSNPPIVTAVLSTPAPDPWAAAPTPAPAPAPDPWAAAPTPAPAPAPDPDEPPF